MNQIEPHDVWVGHVGDARAFAALFATGIRAVVELAAEEAPVCPPRELISMRFPLLDGAGNEVDTMDLAIRTVAELITRRTPTLVCCGAGMSRSPAILAGALAVSTAATPESAAACVAACHAVDVSPALWDEVMKSVSRILALNSKRMG